MSGPDSLPPESPVEKHVRPSRRTDPNLNPEETHGQRALRIALEARAMHADLRLDVDEIKNAFGKPPNPVTGFEGSGIHKPIHRLLVLTEKLAEQKKGRAEWTTWATRVVFGALLLAAVAGGLAWVGQHFH